MAIKKGFVMDGIRPNRIYLNNEEIQNLQFGGLEWSRSVKLTDAEHKMSDLYPNEYTTMKEVPQDLIADGVADMTSMFEGCAGLTSVPKVSTASATNLTNFLKGVNSDAAKAFLEGQVLDFSHIVRNADKTYNINMLGGTSYAAESVSIINPPGGLDAVIKPETLGFPAGSQVKIYLCTANGKKYVPENAKTTTRIAPATGLLAQTLYPTTYQTMEYTPDKISYESVGCLKSAFQGCTNLAIVEFEEISSACIPDTLENMFNGCKNIETVYLDSFDLSKVVSAASIFQGCSSLKSISLPETFSPVNMENAFNGCEAMKKAYLDSNNFSKLTSIAGMFQGCTSLTEVDFPTNFSPATIENAFSGCTAMSSIYVDTLDFSKVTNIAGLFQGCTALKEVGLPKNLRPSHMENAFNGCKLLGDIPIIDMSNVVKNADGKYAVTDMFKGCDAAADKNITFGNASESFIDEITPTDIGKPDLVTIQYRSTDGWLALSPNTPIANTSSIILGKTTLKMAIATTDAAINVDQDFCSTNIRFVTKDYEAIQISATFSIDKNHASVKCYFSEDLAKSTGKPVLVTPNSRYNKIINFVMTEEAKTILDAALKTGNVSVTIDLIAEHNAEIESQKTDKTLSKIDPIPLLVNLTDAKHMMKDVVPSVYRSMEKLPTVFDAKDATDLSMEFIGCSSLKEIDPTKFINAAPTKIGNMFSGCTGLTEIDLSKFMDTSKVTEIFGLFIDCANLKTVAPIDVKGVANAGNFNQMFLRSGVEEVSFKNLTGNAKINLQLGMPDNLLGKQMKVYTVDDKGTKTELQAAAAYTGKTADFNFSLPSANGMCYIKFNQIDGSDLKMALGSPGTSRYITFNKSGHFTIGTGGGITTSALTCPCMRQAFSWSNLLYFGLMGHGETLGAGTQIYVTGVSGKNVDIFVIPT